MKSGIIPAKKSLFDFLLLGIGSLFTSYPGQAQKWPDPELPDTTSLGMYSSRTISLLHSSDPEHRNDVRILVYGQSISEQEWWLEVKRTIQKLSVAGLHLKLL